MNLTIRSVELFSSTQYDIVNEDGVVFFQTSDFGKAEEFAKDYKVEDNKLFNYSPNLSGFEQFIKKIDMYNLKKQVDENKFPTEKQKNFIENLKKFNEMVERDFCINTVIFSDFGWCNIKGENQEELINSLYNRGFNGTTNFSNFDSEIKNIMTELYKKHIRFKNEKYNECIREKVLKDFEVQEEKYNYDNVGFLPNLWEDSMNIFPQINHRFEMIKKDIRFDQKYINCNLDQVCIKENNIDLYFSSKNPFHFLIIEFNKDYTIDWSPFFKKEEKVNVLDKESDPLAMDSTCHTHLHNHDFSAQWYKENDLFEPTGF